MWPSKEGLGAQLSYGVNGNGIVVSSEKVNSKTHKRLPHLEFPRIRNQGITLHKVGKSTITLIGQQTSSFDLNSKVYNNLKDAVARQPTHPGRKMYSDKSLYVPEGILKSYLIESNSLTSTIAYDPTFGQMFAVFDVRSRSGTTFSKAIAFVTGETGTILNICILKYDNKDLLNNKKESAGKVLTPVLADPFQVALSEPIKQIEPCKLKESFDYIPPYLTIRTDSKIYVLNCFKGKLQHSGSHIELDIIGELQTSDLMGYNFADVTFNPWISTQFGVVDIKGNFEIWDINSSKEGLRKLDVNINEVTDSSISMAKTSSTIYDTNELSNWKRITWSYDYNHILLMSRSSLTQFELKPNLNSQKLITSNTWSRIQDIYKSPSDMKFAFMLTSKELIWFELANPLRRLMSWKHFLDDNDPSLRLQVSEYGNDNSYICIIYSQITPVIFVYNFGIRNDMPYSLKDPYYIRRGNNQKGNNNNSPLRQAFLTELNLQFYSSVREDVESNKMDTDTDSDTEFSKPKNMVIGLFELGTDLGLTVSLYSNTVNLSLNKSLKIYASKYSPSYDSSSSFEREYKIKDKLSYFKKIRKADFEPIAKSLDCNTNVIKGEEEIKIVQDYAFKLGEGALKLNEGWSKVNTSNDVSVNKDPCYLSLIDISNFLPLSINDISEFDTMIEQLSTFYESKNIKVANMIRKSLVSKSEIFSRHPNMGQEQSINDISTLLHEAYKNEGLQTYNKTYLIKKLSILIGASLIKAGPDNLGKYYSKKLELDLKQAPTEVKSILDEWDNDNYNISEEPTQIDKFDSQSTVPDIITSSMPTIRIASQGKSTPRSHSRTTSQATKLRHKALAHTSSQIDGYTQSPLSQSANDSDADLSTAMSSQEAIHLPRGNPLSPLRASSSRLPSQLSQKRFMSSQLSGSQRKVKKKKRKGGFA